MSEGASVAEKEDCGGRMSDWEKVALRRFSSDGGSVLEIIDIGASVDISTG